MCVCVYITRDLFNLIKRFHETFKLLLQVLCRRKLPLQFQFACSFLILYYRPAYLVLDHHRVLTSVLFKHSLPTSLVGNERNIVSFVTLLHGCSTRSTEKSDLPTYRSRSFVTPKWNDLPLRLLSHKITIARCTLDWTTETAIERRRLLVSKNKLVRGNLPGAKLPN